MGKWKVANILGMSDRRVKGSEIWDVSVLVDFIWGTLEFLSYFFPILYLFFIFS